MTNFEKKEIAELCKGVHCVDLGESFQTHIFLQNLASTQPRTSPVKLARSLAVQQLPKGGGTARCGRSRSRRAGASAAGPRPASAEELHDVELAWSCEMK